jgi:hypothetical protein
VEALCPQVIWVVSQGAVGVVGVGSVTVCAAAVVVCPAFVPEEELPLD